MQEVSKEWLNNQKKNPQNTSYVRIHIYDADGNEFYTATNNEIFSFSMEQEVYYLNDNLPKYEVQFSLDNIDGTFDIDNTSGLYSKLKIRNKVVVDIGYDLDDGTTEWIKGGTYYLSEWKVSQNSMTAEFTAREWLYFLTNELKDEINLYIQGGKNTYRNIRRALVGDPTFTGDDGTISGFNGLTLNNNVVMEKENEDEAYLSDASFEEQSINELVQLLATAETSTIWMDRENILHIEKKSLTDLSDYEISEDEAFEYPEITLNEDLKDIIVDAYEYVNINTGTTAVNRHITITCTGGSSTGIASGTTKVSIESNTKLGKIDIDNVDNWISSSETFIDSYGNEQPYYKITGTNLNSIEFIDDYWIEIPITGQIYGKTSGSVPTDVICSIYAISYDTNKVEHTISFNGDGCTITIDNQFITNEDIAKKVGNWVGAYSQNRRVIEVSFAADPRLDALDLITIFKKYGGTEKVLVERIKYTWSGGMFHGELRGRSIQETETYDFATNSWDKISQASEDGIADKVYSIGDEKVVKWNGEDVSIRIVAFNHYDKADGSGKVGIVCQTVNCLPDVYYIIDDDSNNTADGYAHTSFYTESAEKILAGFDSDLQAVIKEVIIPCMNGYNDSDFNISNQTAKLFLPSLAEIYSTDGLTTNCSDRNDPYTYRSQYYVEEGTQYEYYQNYIGDNDAYDTNDAGKKNNGDSGKSSVNYYTRTPSVYYTHYWYGIYTDGGFIEVDAYDTYQVAPCFCI